MLVTFQDFFFLISFVGFRLVFNYNFSKQKWREQRSFNTITIVSETIKTCRPVGVLSRKRFKQNRTERPRNGARVVTETR